MSSVFVCIWAHCDQQLFKAIPTKGGYHSRKDMIKDTFEQKETQ